MLFTHKAVQGQNAVHQAQAYGLGTNTLSLLSELTGH